MTILFIIFCFLTFILLFLLVSVIGLFQSFHNICVFWSTFFSGKHAVRLVNIEQVLSSLDCLKSVSYHNYCNL